MNGFRSLIQSGTIVLRQITLLINALSNMACVRLQSSVLYLTGCLNCTVPALVYRGSLRHQNILIYQRSMLWHVKLFKRNWITGNQRVTNG